LPSDVFQVGQDEAESSARRKVVEDIPKGGAKLIEGKVFEHVRAIDGVRGPRLKRQVGNDVAIIDRLCRIN
jgi:hypothetical protein